MWFSDLSADRTRTNAASNNPVLRAITYPMLIGMGAYDDLNQQANTPVEIHEHLREIGMEAWEQQCPVGEHYGSWTKGM